MRDNNTDFTKTKRCSAVGDPMEPKFFLTFNGKGLSTRTKVKSEVRSGYMGFKVSANILSTTYGKFQNNR